MAKPDIDPKAVQSILNRAFPGERMPIFERMTSGGSTQVYRVQRDSNKVYLRFGEETVDTFAPEAWVHEQLVELGARVPRVLFLEDWASEAERSVMITSEIPGAAVSEGGMGSDGASGTDPEVLREAGRDLALVNSILLSGFGFIERSRPWSGKLAGKHPTFQQWTGDVFAEFAELERWFTDTELDEISVRVRDCVADTSEASTTLVHGDFDTSHIFAGDGRYMGLIDFGEIRGADHWYDLADFVVHCDLERDGLEIAALLDGYFQSMPVDTEICTAIESRAVTLGAAMMIRIRNRDMQGYQNDLARSIRALLAGEYLSGLIVR